jgi:hypothetical protein
LLLKYQTHNENIYKIHKSKQITILKKKTPQKTQIIVNSIIFIYKYIQYKNNIILHKHNGFKSPNTLF